MATRRSGRAEGAPREARSADREGRQGILLGLLGAAVVLVIGLVATGLVAHHLQARRAPTRASAERAARDADLVASARGWLARNRLGEALQGTPALRDKLLALDEAARRVDPIQARLPSDRAARRPDQVGTIILVRRGSERVGLLPGGREELVRTAEVTIVDVVEAVIVGRRTFRGPRATARERAEAERGLDGADLVGPELHVQVAEWITALPQE